MATKPDLAEVKAAIAANPPAFYGPHLPQKITRDNNRWKSACPLHADSDPSFTIYPDGSFHCYGCNENGDGLDFLQKLLNIDLPAALEEAAGRLGLAAQSKPQQQPAEKRYQIIDAAGQLVAEHVRTDLPGGKTFRWERNGQKTLGGLRVVDLPLYGLPALLAADPAAVVVVTEGEKAADALTRAGTLAVGTACGAAATPSDDTLRPLVGHEVIVWADADDNGRKHMGAIEERLRALGVTPCRVTWADAPPKSDAFDFLAKHGPEKLQALLATATQPAPEATAEASSAEPIAWASASSLAARTGATEWLWEPWIPRGHITVLAGEPGVGKSAVALYFAGCISTGLRWPDDHKDDDFQPAPVLIADSEGAQAIWVNRIRDWQLDPDLLFFPGLDAMGRLMLDDAKVLDGVRARVEQSGVPLVVIDSLRTSLPGSVDENSSAVGSILAPWADLCRDANISLLIVHHFGKPRKDEGSAPSLNRVRGSSAITAQARSIIAVDRPDAENTQVRLSCVKNNLALMPEPLGLQIGGTGIEWTEQAPRSPRRETAVDNAEEFLLAKLQRGPMASIALVIDAEANDISRRSLYAARKKLGAVIVPDPTDPRRKRTLWSLAADEAGVA